MNHYLTKLKVGVKRWWGYSVYYIVCAKNKTKNIIAEAKEFKSSKKKFKIFSSLLSRRRPLIYVMIAFLGIYYGLGALISSEINNKLEDHQHESSSASSYAVKALADVLKVQVDDNAWTPALPIIFPAALLDNQPNFQLGAKEGVTFFINKLAHRFKDDDLMSAAELLEYPSDIWLFSSTKDDSLAPGSAKQYRKALAHIRKFLKKNAVLPANRENLLYILKSSDAFISQKIDILHKHIREHSSEVLDFSADDIFYKTIGSAYTLYYFLAAVTKDYQSQILEVEQYENMTTVLKYLAETAEMSPLVVKNASPNDAFEANHLMYLGYYLSVIQSKLQQVYYQVLLFSERPLP